MHLIGAQFNVCRSLESRDNFLNIVIIQVDSTYEVLVDSTDNYFLT